MGAPAKTHKQHSASGHQLTLKEYVFLAEVRKKGRVHAKLGEFQDGRNDVPFPCDMSIGEVRSLARRRYVTLEKLLGATYDSRLDYSYPATAFHVEMDEKGREALKGSKRKIRQMKEEEIERQKAELARIAAAERAEVMRMLRWMIEHPERVDPEQLAYLYKETPGAAHKANLKMFLPREDTGSDGKK